MHYEATQDDLVSDLLDSMERAMLAEHISELTIVTVINTVRDYYVNHYGD